MRKKTEIKKEKKKKKKNTQNTRHNIIPIQTLTESLLKYNDYILF